MRTMLVTLLPKKDRSYYETRGEVVWEISTDEKVIAVTRNKQRT